MRIKKVINNNILCTIDEKGNEMIVTGRGIGFQRHRGERIDPSLIERTYRMEDRREQQKLRELVDQIPLEHLQLTEQLIAYFRTQITQQLNESLLITLSDHISFAIQRKRDGIEFHNPLKGAVMCYYPVEYHLGQYCLEEIDQQLGVRLHEDEAAFIALHIVNAELNTQMSEMYDITQLIDGSVSVVEQFYGRKFQRNSLDFSRFVVHLRYFAQRLFRGKTMPDTADEADEAFRRMISRSCEQHYACAKHIGAFIEETYHKQLSEEELTYLTIHLKRISMGGVK